MPSPDCRNGTTCQGYREHYIENEGSLCIPVFTQRGAKLVGGDICWSHQMVLLLRREFELHDVGLGRDNSGD